MKRSGSLEGSTKSMTMRRYEVLAILGVFLLSSVLVAGLGAISPSSTGAHSSIGSFGGQTSGRSPVTAAAGPVLSGPGEFFTSSAFPLASFADRTCTASILPGGSCPAKDHANVTNDLSMNYTSHGVLAVAYTTLTNESPCDASLVENYSQSNIAFLTSSDSGATWSSVQYLGNADCQSAATYPSSWEPTLTSLSNGTLVLAYVEFNTSQMVPFLSASAPPVTQLVVTESYTNGATWTPQQVVNVSSDPSLLVTFPAMRPSIAASGSTIYLTWMSMQVSASGANPGADSEVSLLVSTNGGKSWSPTLPMTSSPYTNSGNPEVIVNPAGRAFLAYSSSLPYSGTVYVLSSTNDFTSWTTGFVGSSYNGGLTGLGPFGLTSPRMAWNSLYHELYVGYVGGVYSGAPLYSTLPDVYLATSLNNGSSFLSHAASQNAFFQLSGASSSTGGPYGTMGVYQVELAVTSANNLQMEGLLVNNTLCRSSGCGFKMEVAVNSSNNGTTFTGPFVINGTITLSASGWAGEDTSLLSAGTHLWYGWEQMTCPTSPTTSCSIYQKNPGGPLAFTQAMISQRFTGTGTTITFDASGLNSTTPWLVNLMGNVRSGNGTFALSVSGVPTGETVFWAIPGPNISSTVRYYVTSQTTFPPTTLTGALTDDVTFTEYALFSVKATPSNIGQAMNPATCLQVLFSYNVPGSYFEQETSDNCANYVMSPYSPGTSFWARTGASVNLSISPADFINDVCMFSATPPHGFPNPSNYPSFYYVYCTVSTLNYTFLSWQGTGNGSVSSNHLNITVIPYGPVTETANFFQTGSCGGYAYWETYTGGSYHYANIGCSELTTTFTFAEHGLPKDLAWGVNIGAPNNATAIGGYGTSPGTVSVGGLFMATPYTISPMSIPTADPSMFWVGTSEAGSIIVSPDSNILDVNYTLESIAGTQWTLNVTEEGLPTGATWSYTVTPAGGSAATYSTASSVDTEFIAGGVNYSVNGTFLPGTTGVGYTVTAVSYSVSNVNATPIINGTAPGDFNITGDTYVVLWYTPVWWVTVEAGSGGTVAPASEWVVNGTLLTLTARANPGQVFVGWTGYGLGASSLSQRHTLRISILPGGPITEIATFAPRPPPTWTLTVSQSGLPAAQPYSVSLGGTTFTGAGTFAITNLSTGNYALTVPYVYDNLTVGTRYLPGAPASSLNLTAGSLDVISNGTVSLIYSVQVLLTVTGTVGGTVSMPGSTWVQLNTQIALTATPSTGYYFVAWNGTGNGAQTSTSRTISIRPLLGPVSEAASFILIPPKPPAVYHVAVSETGLPTTAHWNLTAGNASAFGSGSTLVLGGLNGSYTLMVPTVYTAQGIRYVPNATGGSYSLDVNANGTFSISFTEQVLITVDISGTGNVTGTVPATGAGSSLWLTANSAVQLTAGVGPGGHWKFSQYNVTYLSGSTSTGLTSIVNFTASGPATVTMTFVPIYPKITTGSSSDGMVLDLALLGVLLVAGLGAGVVLARRRRRQPPAAATPEPMETWQENPTDSEMSPPAQ